MNEAEVIVGTRGFLKSKLSLEWNIPVANLYTDTHHSLTRLGDLRPFQRFSIDLGDFIVHPDIVGQLDDGETLLAVEAKGDKDILKGLAQAELYQQGFHYSFLAADASALGTTYIELARSKNIGVLAVGDSVRVAHLPQARMPLRDKYQFIARQMDSVIQVSSGQTFQFNIPTHYLAWAIALEPDRHYVSSELPALLDIYPMPQAWRSTLAGAQKLGLVTIRGDEVRLSASGEAVKAILPGSLAAWADVHRVIGRRGRSIPLVQHLPQAAAVLRLLLLNDPMVRLVVAGLCAFEQRSTTFDELAAICDQLDHARAPIFFLKPEAAVELADKRGRIAWHKAEGTHYRSRMFYQYKSILKHGGILQDVRLGGATTRGYDPTNDIWALR